MGKDLGYGLKKVLSAKQLGVSLPLKPQRKTSLAEGSDRLLMLRFQRLHLERLHKHYSGTRVFHEDVKWGQTWRTGLREANFNVIAFISQKRAQFISVTPRVYLSVCLTVQLPLFRLIELHLDTVSPNVRRRMSTSAEKKCSDQRSLGCLVKTRMFLPERSWALVTSCSAMWTDLCFQSMEPDVAIDLCVELPWILSPHPLLPFFFPLLLMYCHVAWTLFNHWRGSSCLIFWGGFSEWLSIYFFSSLKFD